MNELSVSTNCDIYFPFMKLWNKRKASFYFMLPKFFPIIAILYRHPRSNNNLIDKYNRDDKII